MEPHDQSTLPPAAHTTERATLTEDSRTASELSIAGSQGLQLLDRIGKAFFCISLGSPQVILDASHKGAELVGTLPNAMIGAAPNLFFPDGVTKCLQETPGTPGLPPRVMETMLSTPETPERYVEWTLHAMTENDIAFLLLEARDISARKYNENNLKNLSRAVEQSPVVVMITDVNGVIEYVNPRFCQVTGYTLEETIGNTPSMLKSGFTSPIQYKDLWQTIIAGQEWRGEFLNRKKNGELFWEHISISPIRREDGEISRFIAVKEDISVRKEHEKRILYQAHYDELTKLPNRILVTDRLSQALTRASRNNACVGIAFIDLDGFKKVNDTLGHTYGDDLLRQAARRLMTCIRASDTVGRLGGDEFLVIIPDLNNKDHARIVTNNILKAFEKPFAILAHSITTTASIGLTIYPDDGKELEILMRNADAAMYSAKECGRNYCSSFHPSMNENAMRRLRMESLLSGALTREEMHLVYQPQVNTITQDLVGAEALLRWNCPELGPVNPFEFIKMAEDTGMIEPIGKFVLESACAQLAQWRDRLPEEFRISINASPKQFMNDTFVTDVMHMLEVHNLPPHMLEIEITEGLFALNSSDIVDYMNRLSAKGVRLAVDDFGTGYSALSYLREFPVNTVKVDRSFMIPVGEPAADSLVRAIVTMGHSLSLDVVAEGVETEDQMRFLRNINCDITQGYYIDKPLSTDDFCKYLR